MIFRTPREKYMSSVKPLSAVMLAILKVKLFDQNLKGIRYICERRYNNRLLNFLRVGLSFTREWGDMALSIGRAITNLLKRRF